MQEKNHVSVHDLVLLLDPDNVGEPLSNQDAQHIITLAAQRLAWKRLPWNERKRYLALKATARKAMLTLPKVLATMEDLLHPESVRRNLIQELRNLIESLRQTETAHEQRRERHDGTLIQGPWNQKAPTSRD